MNLKRYFSSYWVRSAFFTFFQRFSLTFFGFINFVLLTRTLTIRQMGTWALFFTITGIFEQTKSNLLKNAHIKFVSASSDHDEQSAIAASSFLINASLTLFFVLLVILFSNWLALWFDAGVELAQMLQWFIPGMLFMIFFAHLEAVQQSNLDFRGGFAGYLVRQVLFCGVILFHKLTRRPVSLAYLSMYQSMTIGMGTIVLYFFSRKYLFYRFNASKLWIKRIFGYGGYIFGSGMVANISQNLDQLMTGKLLAPGYVAYYSIASRINLLVDIPSFAAAEVLFPKASQASAGEGRGRVKYLYEKMVAVLLAFTLPTALVIIVFPHLITILIAGTAYAAAAPILQMYMVTGLFRPAQNQAANLLNSIGRPKLVFWANSVTLIVSLTINYFCLRRFGFYGAAIGTMTATLLCFVYWYFIMRREIDLELGQVLRHTMEVYKTVYTKGLGMLRKPAPAVQAEEAAGAVDKGL